MNENIFIWTSDWHIDRLSQASATALVDHIAALDPAGVIDTGDCTDDYSNPDEFDSYNAAVREVMPWASVNPGANAPFPILPGNHDELNDYVVPGSDFSPFDAKEWGAPYHWTCDWAAPQVRFIAFHARIVHADDSVPYPGSFAVDPLERQWLTDALAALPEGWQAIVCSHPPLDPTFGNNIGHWSWLPHGGTEIRASLVASGKVCAYLNGHRHQNMLSHVLDGIQHFSGPGVAYTLGNGHGGFVPIDYDPAARTLTFRYHLARAPFAGYVGYTPAVVQLPPLEVEPPPPTNVELAITELKLTTVGYKNKYWTEPPEGTHWRNALDLLEAE